MPSKNHVRPSLSVLTPAQIEEIHGLSLRVLSSVGLRVDAERARELYQRALGPAAIDGDRVRIPNETVEWALQVAPRAVDIYDRQGEHAFRMPGETRFGIGVTSLHYQDPETDQVTPFARGHMASMVRLGAALPSFDVISTVGIIQDVPVELSDMVAALEMVANTVKPLVVLVSDEAAFPDVLRLLDHLRGDLSGRPCVLPYLNPITPLVQDRGTVGKLWHAVERGLPVIYSTYGMAGASTPITASGSLVLLNAELLAGLTLGQLIRQGAPMVLGSLPAYFDMRGKGSYYTPTSYVLDLAGAEMMAHYRLPHSGTSGSGMGWSCELVTAGHQWTNHLLSCLGKVGLAPFVGDILGAMAYSPATAVYANDIIAQARRLARGFTLDDGEASLDEIARAGPGGDFLTSEQTLNLFRTASQGSQLFDSLTLDQWQAQDMPSAVQRLRRHTRKVLARLAVPEDYEELVAKGEVFIAAHRRR